MAYPWSQPTNEQEADAIADDCETMASGLIALYGDPQFNPGCIPEAVNQDFCAKLCEAKALVCPTYQNACRRVLALIEQFGCDCGSDPS